MEEDSAFDIPQYHGECKLTFGVRTDIEAHLLMTHSLIFEGEVLDLDHDSIGGTHEDF